MKQLCQARCFERMKFGRVSRSVFWSTAAADVVLLAVAFMVPLEAAYQLQLEPTGWFMRIWLSSWICLALVLLKNFFRLARRRLHDVGNSGLGLFWVLVPAVGWLWLAWLLARPSVQGKTQYDDLA